MLKKLVLSLAALLLIANTAMAAEKTVSVAHDATWPPMEFVGSDKKLTGYAIDYIQAVAKEAGFKVKSKNQAWDGIFGGLDAGRYDAIVSSVTITEERQKTYDFSLPYYDVHQALVVPAASEAKTFEDMKGKTVGGQIGTTAIEVLKKYDGVKVKSYDEIGLAMEDLFNGRIDGVVCDDPVAKLYAVKKPQYQGKMKLVATAPEVEHLGMVVKKGNKEMVELLNKGIKAVKEKGIEAELIKKWMGN